MRPVITLLAEHAERRADGRIDILGMHSTVESEKWPAHHKAVLVLELRIPPEENKGIPHVVDFQIEGEDGERMGNVGRFTIDISKLTGTPPWYMTIFQPIGLDVSGPGRWNLAVRHQGAHWHSLPIVAKQV